MTNLNEKMMDLKNKQKKLLEDLELIVNEYESTDLILEHEALKKEYEAVKARFQELKTSNAKINQENAQLRAALHEQILDEKLNIIKISKEKLETYFKQESGKYNNKLESIERITRENIIKLRNKANKELAEDKQGILNEIEQLSIELNEKIQERREKVALEEKLLLDGANFDINELRSDSIDEEVIQRRIKQNQIEMKIGLNWVNKIGIILILFGVGAASKYTYSTWFNDYMKGIFFFLLGGLLLIGGEWAFRKARQVFAKGILGGGISVLYGAIFYSYFLLKILNLSTALLLSVGVTVLTIVLSLRYNSRTIISLGLLGGYLPLFSYVFAFGLSGNGYYSAMGYLFLLNLSVLLISLKKKWNITNYLSFVLHIPSLTYLVLSAPNELIGMVYSILAFLMYLAITLSYSLKEREKLHLLDVILLALNTFFSVVIVYILFDIAEWNNYRGLLALIFAIVYISLGKFVERVMREEKQTIVLFYSTSLTFAFLMVPFQFGVQWLALGWLLEGIALIIYGYRIKHKMMEYSGWGIYLISLFFFYLNDFLQNLVSSERLRYFDFKFAVVTMSMLIVSYFYLKEKSKKVEQHNYLIFHNIRFFKYWSLLNVWVYLLYSGVKLYNNLVSYENTHYDFYKSILIACITFGTGYAISKISIIQDKVVLYYRLFLYIVGDITFLYITTLIPVLKPIYSENIISDYLALAVLILFNIFVFLSLRDLALFYIRRYYKNIEIYPLFIGVYLLGIITAFLIAQFRLGDYNLLFSLVYLIMAIGFILYGFVRRFVYIRRFGLALSLLSTTKLFIFDLSYLEQGSKIIAYFSFGLLLLGISFIYQKVSNSIENPVKMEEKGADETL